MLLGLGSAVEEYNVPLVAASMGMFQEPLDSHLWHFRCIFSRYRGKYVNYW